MVPWTDEAKRSPVEGRYNSAERANAVKPSSFARLSWIASIAPRASQAMTMGLSPA
jgi:hypothetical protein